VYTAEHNGEPIPTPPRWTFLYRKSKPHGGSSIFDQGEDSLCAIRLKDEMPEPEMPEPEVDPLVMYIERHFEDSSTDKLLIRNCAEAAAHDYHEHVKRNAPKPQDGPLRAGFNGEPVASNVEFTNALKAVQGEAPEPEVPEAIKDLISEYATDSSNKDALVRAMARGHNADVIEAYRRGQQSKEGAK